MAQTTPRYMEILGASAELFRKRGFAAVTVNEIGRSAGVSGPGIYRHFQSKDDILGALFEEGMDGLLRVTAGNFDDPHEELRHLAYQHARYVLRSGKWASTWIREERSLVDPYRRSFARRAGRYVDRWSEAVRRCYPDRSEDDIRIAVRAALAALNSPESWPRPLQRDDHVRLLAEAVVAGLDVLAVPTEEAPLAGQVGERHG